MSHWNKDFSSPSCTSNPLILVRILFQTSFVALKTKKGNILRQALKFWATEWGRGWSWKHKRSLRNWVVSQGRAQQERTSGHATYCSRRNVRSWENKHIPSDAKHSLSKWLQFLSIAAFTQVISKLQSQTWGLNPISIPFKLCELEQVTQPLYIPVSTCSSATMTFYKQVQYRKPQVENYCVCMCVFWGEEVATCREKCKGSVREIELLKCSQLTNKLQWSGDTPKLERNQIINWWLLETVNHF